MRRADLQMAGEPEGTGRAGGKGVDTEERRREEEDIPAREGSSVCSTDGSVYVNQMKGKPIVFLSMQGMLIYPRCCFMMTLTTFVTHVHRTNAKLELVSYLGSYLRRCRWKRAMGLIEGQFHRLPVRDGFQAAPPWGEVDVLRPRHEHRCRCRFPSCPPPGAVRQLSQGQDRRRSSVHNGRHQHKHPGTPPSLCPGDKRIVTLPFFLSFLPSPSYPHKQKKKKKGPSN